MDQQTAGTIKICPKCNAAFTCNPNACWCSELPAVMPMQDNAECYCPKCLKAIIEEKIAGVN